MHLPTFPHNFPTPEQLPTRKRIEKRKEVKFFALKLFKVD